MNLTKILRWLVIGGLFIIPFTPLFVTSSFFFPFITGKAFFFRIVVEIIAAAWIILALLEAKYRPQRSFILWTALTFLVVITLATIFSVNPGRSFWSNFERMEGLVTHLPLFLYFLVATSVLSVSNLWRRFFQTSLGVSVIVAFYGIFQLLGFLTINQGGVRLDATFGNATYLAIYMVFHIFLAAWFFIGANKRWEKVVYGLIALLELVILYYTATRGAILGLIAGALVTLAILAWRSRGKARKVSLGVIAAIIILIGVFIAAKDLPMIKNNPVLGRFASISTTETTTQSRFIIWQMGWQGFKENPILGWGPENYNLVFNKYYDARLWRQEQWFDRSHNIIFDWLIAAGLLGLLSYLAILVSAWWTIKKTSLSLKEKGIFSGLLVAYFVHNFFVFDNLVSYIMFFSVLAFLASLATGKRAELPNQKKLNLGIVSIASVAVIVVFLGAFYLVNAKPILTNRELMKAMTPAPINNAEEAKAMVADRLSHFQKAVNYNTFGTSEVREQLVQWTIQVASSPIVANDQKDVVAKYAFEQLSKQITETPDDARYQVFVGLFLNALNQKDAAVVQFNKALTLSPNKPTILLEIARAEASNNHMKAALVAAKQALDLDDSNTTARTLYAALLIYNGDLKTADQVLTDGFGSTIVNDDTILNAYADARLFNRVLDIWKLKTETNPNVMQNWVSLAAAYLSVGERAKSIEALEKAVTVNPDFRAEADKYISDIKSGLNP